MIPTPFLEYLPKSYTRDSATLALAAKADSHPSRWFDDIKSIQFAMDPVKAPSALLDEIGNLMNAGVQNIDSDRTKRQKIMVAVQGHKNRGVWTLELKPKIDSITGRTDSVIIRVQGTDEWVLMSENYPPDFYWAALGADGLDDKLGPYPLATADDAVIAGNIWIDLQVTQSAAVVQQIRDAITLNYLPAYFVIYLGYTDLGSHGFIILPNGVI